MAYCSNCGKELKEGAKFCEECGAKVGTVIMEQPVVQETVVTPEAPKKNGTFGLVFSIMVFVLSIVTLFVGVYDGLPITIIVLSVITIICAIVALAKKFRLKGFDIAAIIISTWLLVVGLANASQVGLMHDKVNSKLKSAMDAYERQVDEYVEYVESVRDNSESSLSALAKYAAATKAGLELMETFDEIDTSELSDADYDYYLEVTTRCNEKILKVIGSNWVGD